MPVASDAVIYLKVENGLVKVCGPKDCMMRLLQEQAILQLTSIVGARVGWVWKELMSKGNCEVRVRYRALPDEPFSDVRRWLDRNYVKYKLPKKPRQRTARMRPRFTPRANGGSHASHQ
jgi:hypothetical protein